ncbi:VOC family protein [Kiloniella majae]|uniref:VOC family protein n=1 Tax=Kiloniella majae TaxID=1938558 RepID=UPI000A277B29|nr:VOC family protein [Kiloniella majae]
MIFNHVQIKVKDLEISKAFYDRIMSTLGYDQVLDIPDMVIGYGTSVHDMFEIRQTDEEAPLSRAVHISFNARDRKSVDEFYRIALENGATCNGKPGLRPEYEEGYYAAFILDPDGHNIEAVYAELRE